MLRRLKRLIKRILFSILPSTTALMFHHIDDGHLIVKSGCRLAKSKFLEIIDSEISFITMDEYVRFPYSWRNPCTITFDDGLKDVYRVAYPELKKRGIPFTVFVVTDYLDTDGYLTTEELLELSSAPLVTIGSHGVTHEILKGMTMEQQREELVKSKHILQNIIHKPIRYFAYSHGQYDAVSIKLLRSTRCYDFAFSAGGGITNLITLRSRFTLPRMDCEDGVNSFYIKRHKNRTRLMSNI